MKCKDVLNLIDDAIDNKLKPSEQIEVDKHCHTCESCKQVAEQTEQLISGLNNLAFEAHSEDFESRVFQKVKDAYPENKNKVMVKRFAGAIAASVAFWIGSILILPNADVSKSEQISIALHQTQNVKLMINSPAHFENVTFKLTMPSNLVLSGLNNQSVITWNAKLNAGPNVLTLPVTAIAEGQSAITAEIKLGDTIKVFKVLLKTNKHGLKEAEFTPTNKLLKV